MKIAQITFHNALNCGAVLQTWALQTVLERMGNEVFQPDCNSVGTYAGHFPKSKIVDRSLIGIIRHFVWWIGSGLLSLGCDELKVLRFRSFRRRCLHVVPCVKSAVSELAELAVFGSDQIWNETWTKDESEFFQGATLPAGFQRIAYGVSVGDGPVDGLHLMENARRFSAISVRERFAFDAPIVLDPTLLLKRSDYLGVEYPRRLVKERFLFCFNLSGDRMLRTKAREMARMLDVGYVEADMSQKGLWRCPTYVKATVSPDRLLAYIRDAEFVVTNSFHGTAFSILYEKNFLSFSDAGAKGRIGCLLHSVGMEARMPKTNERGADLCAILTSPFSADVKNKLDELRISSINWLRHAISSRLSGCKT